MKSTSNNKRDTFWRHLIIQALFLAVLLFTPAAEDGTLLKMLSTTTAVVLYTLVMTHIVLYTLTSRKFTHEASINVGLIYVGTAIVVTGCVIGLFIALHWDSMLPGK